MTFRDIPEAITQGESVEDAMTSRRRVDAHGFDDALRVAGRGKRVPHEFVLDALADLSPTTRVMFGCLAVYVEEKIILVLRDKPKGKADNGVWLATTAEHHESLRREFPRMRSIGVLGKEVTGWQVLPADAADFEEAALRACELILRGDPRIGKIPKRHLMPRPRKEAQKRRKAPPKSSS